MRVFSYFVLLALCIGLSSGNGPYLSPGMMAVDDTRHTLYTALATAKAIAVTDLKSGQAKGKIFLKRHPNYLLLSPDGSTLYVSSGEAGGTVEIFKLPKNKPVSTIPVGHKPSGMVLSHDGGNLFVANRFSNTVSVINLKSGKTVADIPAVREPHRLTITPDGKTVAITHVLPAQAAVDTIVAAQITLIDASTCTVRSRVTLPNGAQSIRGIACFSGEHDGKYLYITHLLSRYNMPITQLDRGWVNTNALSIIDLTADSVYATVLLDDIDRGAANPAGICAGDDGKLYIALSGTHELMVVDRKGLHEKLEMLFSGKLADAYIKNKEDLNLSLTFLAPYKKRISLQGRSPREVISAGGKIYVSSYFSTFIEVVPEDSRPATTLTLGQEPLPDNIRRGELAFSDATLCYQHWQSCTSCHPDGRTDGLNWDQLNDGLGNPKNTKSLLYSHFTPPSMITGIRESAELAVRKGILHILQTQQPEQIAVDMDEYLKHLTPVESPFLPQYKKTDPKQIGKKLFEQAKCSQCHYGKYFTDLQKYDVGTGTGNDKGQAFDTPSLNEIWRTAPYLYDGRAVTLHEVFTKYNPDDRHGITNGLSEKELDALILYIKTL